MSLLNKANIITTPTAYSVGKLHSVKPENEIYADFDFARNSSATRVGENGLIQSVAANLPRINYENGIGHLLLEPQRTNLITYSEDFSGYGSSNAVITNNSITSPDGTLSGTILADDNAGGTSAVQVYDNVTVDVSSDYTFSIFAKKKDLDFVALRLGSFTTPISDASFFNLNLGTVVSAGSGHVAEIENYGNGWYRCSVTFTTDAADTDGNLQIRMSENGTNTAVDLDNTSNIYIWGWQFEKGYLTSYIPTSGSATTRLAEVCNGSGNASTFNDSEGVLMVQIGALTEIGTSESITVSSGSINNRILFRYNSTNQIRIIVISAAIFSFDRTINISNITEYNKFAIKYKQNDFALWANGLELETDTSGNTPIGLSELAFDDGSGSNDFYGKTKQLQYFPEALTDSELECLTSWSSFNRMAIDLNYTIQ